MDDHSKSQVKRLITQSPEYAAGYKAGREAGMREAVKVARSECRVWADGCCRRSIRNVVRAIVAAIGGGK